MLVLAAAINLVWLSPCNPTHLAEGQRERGKKKEKLAGKVIEEQR